jgi:hypothetical protein
MTTQGTRIPVLYKYDLQTSDSIHSGFSLAFGSIVIMPRYGHYWCKSDQQWFVYVSDPIVIRRWSLLFHYFGGAHLPLPVV